ncbi:hypothetical protein [Sandarakinorhabdus sp.]|uniref:hypothetical protein n=1 Tax=Sandarakinorhabdus sp. TaxID=1916663 RepID=UPI00286E6E90|nr:hypothetical protein [Sandarakinorhabdus sp.]
MLSPADDYPIHQTPEPIAVSGSDRNFYDRYFFNAQAPDGGAMLGVAMGIYPHLNIIDCAVSVTDGTVQRSLFASRILGADRMDTHAGPVRIHVEQPLKRLRITIADNDTGISGDMVFTGRAAPIEEPRFTRRLGSRMLMDATRMTQGGDWQGHIAAGAVHDLAGWRGTRDRSWGVRPIGAADPQPVVPQSPPQFFWLWTPTAFDDWLLFFHSNDDAAGAPWNRAAVLVRVADGAHFHLQDPRMALAFRAGSRHAGAARLEALMPDGTPVGVDFRLGANFLMRGLGYGHPVRGHGMFQGADVLAHEDFVIADIDPAAPMNAHVQAQAEAVLTIGDKAAVTGRGIFEQLAIGPHAPSGFTDLFDLAG